MQILYRTGMEKKRTKPGFFSQSPSKKVYVVSNMVVLWNDHQTTMMEREMDWDLLWKGLAAGDRNGGPVRLATLLYQSLEDNFSEQKTFTSYADWIKNGGFDTGPTLFRVVQNHQQGMSISDAVYTHHQMSNGTAGIGPAHRSAGFLCVAKEDELVGLAMREAKLTHWDSIAGQASAASLLISLYLHEGRDFAAIADSINHRFPVLEFESQELSRGGYAPAVLRAAWHFLMQSTSFFDALEESLVYAGSSNYCPVLVGLWAACLYKDVPDICLAHAICPQDSQSIAVC